MHAYGQEGRASTGQLDHLVLGQDWMTKTAIADRARPRLLLSPSSCSIKTGARLQILLDQDRRDQDRRQILLDQDRLEQDCRQVPRPSRDHHLHIYIYLLHT